MCLEVDGALYGQPTFSNQLFYLPKKKIENVSAQQSETKPSHKVGRTIAVYNSKGSNV